MRMNGSLFRLFYLSNGQLESKEWINGSVYLNILDVNRLKWNS